LQKTQTIKWRKKTRPSKKGSDRLKEISGEESPFKNEIGSPAGSEGKHRLRVFGPSGKQSI